MKIKPLQSNLPKLISEYLRKRSFGNYTLELGNKKLYKNVIVVPAIQECENIKNLLDSISQCNPQYFSQTLVIFVVNNFAISSQEVKLDNNCSLTYLRSIILQTPIDELSKRICESGLNIGLVDASSNGNEMPEKEGGVGLARKIGMDLALYHFDYLAAGKNILICLDSDCTVDENYLTEIVNEFNQRNINAGYVQYFHNMPADKEEQAAIICYEIFLRYYVLSLNFAKSPYAIDTIGSTMICDVESYAKIGGMNMKKAAEDFYFMEKLSKITEIHKITSTKVYPSPRKSWRVPFGTGQRINRYFLQTHDEYQLFNPESFVVLKKWLEIFNGDDILSEEEYLLKAKLINESLYEFLIQNSFRESWKKILADTKKKEQLIKQKKFWFDGFRTLKLIHFLRDKQFPPINMFDALDIILLEYGKKISRSESIPSLEIQQQYLNELRSLS